MVTLCLFYFHNWPFPATAIPLPWSRPFLFVAQTKAKSSVQGTLSILLLLTILPAAAKEVFLKPRLMGSCSCLGFF
jgi:hypothetical protein